MVLKDVPIRRGIAFLEPSNVVMKGYLTEELDANREAGFARGLRMRLGSVAEAFFRSLPCPPRLTLLRCLASPNLNQTKSPMHLVIHQPAHRRQRGLQAQLFTLRQTGRSPHEPRCAKEQGMIRYHVTLHANPHVRTSNLQHGVVYQLPLHRHRHRHQALSCLRTSRTGRPLPPPLSHPPTSLPYACHLSAGTRCPLVRSLTG
jgi:hypothetical protein